MENSNKHINIRPATDNDCPMIARNVLAALGWDMYKSNLSSELQNMENQLIPICRRTDTLYSWTNTIIAELDGEAVGCLVSYDGADYKTLREVTFKIISEFSHYDFSVMEQETGPGEYYIDSIAVHPAYRGRGIAGNLMRYCIETCFAQGFPQISLLVNPDNLTAKRLYTAQGFQPEGFVDVFDSHYQKMICRKL